MTTPTDADRQAAEKLLVQLRRTTSHSEGAGSINLPISALLHAIAQAIADARAVRPGHVRLDTGDVVRVLGTLPMTKDGCLLGEGAIVWREATASMTGTVKSERLELAWGLYGLCGANRTKAGGWYSTKEAAEAALAARGEK